MPDITMCQNDSCVKREECFRFTAKPKEQMQSWSTFEPTNNDEEFFHCYSYWRNFK